MPVLKCEICGGRLILNTDGTSVCDSCGLRYSTDWLKEKLFEKGTVEEESLETRIENWMKNAEAAFDVENYQEAYAYFKKVMDADPDNWRAIYGKGKAGAWQTTVLKPRDLELRQGIEMALKQMATSEMSDETICEIKNEFACALYDITGRINELYVEACDRAEEDGRKIRIHDRFEERCCFDNIKLLEFAAGLIADFHDDNSKRNLLELKKAICRELSGICQNLRYSEEPVLKDGSRTYSTYAESFRTRYLDLVYEIRETDPDFAWNCPDPFELYLPEEECEKQWKEIDRKRKAGKEEQEREARRKAYWLAHVDEQERYLRRMKEIDSDIASILEKIRQNKERIAEIDQEFMNETAFDPQLEAMEKEQYNLQFQASERSFFELSRKRKLQEQISRIQTKVDERRLFLARQKQMLREKADSQIEIIQEENKRFWEQKNALEKEKKEMEDELQKER